MIASLLLYIVCAGFLFAGMSAFHHKEIALSGWMLLFAYLAGKKASELSSGDEGLTSIMFLVGALSIPLLIFLAI